MFNYLKVLTYLSYFYHCFYLISLYTLASSSAAFLNIIKIIVILFPIWLQTTVNNTYSLSQLLLCNYIMALPSDRLTTKFFQLDFPITPTLNGNMSFGERIIFCVPYFCYLLFFCTTKPLIRISHIHW